MKKYILTLLVSTLAYLAHAVSMITGSFNLYGLPQEAKYSKERIALATSLIKYHDFDILATQDNLNWQTTEILKVVNYKTVGVNVEGKQPANDNFATNNIFYKPEKYLLLDKGSFWLSDTPNKKSNTWENKFPLNCNWAKFKDNASGKEFFVFNTRFSYPLKTRILASKLLVKKVKEIAKNSTFIVAGSLYTRERELDTMKALSPRFLIDTFKVAKKTYGPKGTFTNLNYNEPIENTKNYMDPRMKHDYIFVSKNVKVLKCAHLSDNINNAYPSKHLPVEAYIEF
ncbi:MAG: hypothetical protein E7035_06830 [Verrucomicrobiaceae bacterium]|nr:hypothetical protein [Verrucomicrobiaceae bacterium]